MSCAGRSATNYRVVREPLPRMPTAFQGSQCVRGGIKRREYQVRARYQMRANALLRGEICGVRVERLSRSRCFVEDNSPLCQCPLSAEKTTVIVVFFSLQGLGLIRPWISAPCELTRGGYPARVNRCLVEEKCRTVLYQLCHLSSKRLEDNWQEVVNAKSSID